MSGIVYAVQLVGILIPVAGIFVLAFKEQNRASLYLMLTNVGCLILNCGHLLVLVSQSFDAARMALNMEYFGNVMFYLSFALFLMTYLNLRKLRLILFWWAIQDSAALFFLWSGINERAVYPSIRFYKTTLGVSLLNTEIGSLQVARYGLICTVLAAMMIYTSIRMLRIANRRERTNFGKLAGAQFIIVATLSLNVAAITTYDIAPLFSSFAILAIILGVIHGEFFSVIDQGKSWLVENMPSAFIIADKDFGYQDANAYAKRLFPQLRRLRKARRLPDEVIDLIENSEDHLQLGDEYYDKTVTRILQKDEEMGFALLLLNTTEDHLLLEQVQEARERADAANKAKSSFLANMSHEIRTPINAILGMDEMILRESGEDEIVSYAADIQSAGKTLLSLINDILDFSKVEEGKMEILPTQYELGSIVNDLVNMSRPRAEKKGLRLEVHVDEKTPHLLYGDEIRIRQCALNILTNAVKYTEKGSVTLTVGYDLIDDDRIYLRFSVSDTGIGMKQEDMDKLYSPFERIEEARNRAVEGTGLGMSITKQLLALMGTHLEVQSVYGEGSTFSFAVEQPVIKWDGVGKFSEHYDAPVASREAYHELFHAPDARILVVDDTEANLTVMKGLLKRTQLVIDTAESGKESLIMAAQTAYDVIFIDHMMPDMDGMETLHELRKLPGLENVPCVALTANAISGAREMYLEAGFTDYLSKPVDGGRLERLLMETLPPEKVLAPGETPSAPLSTVELPDWLHEVGELDTAQGLLHCGTEETYLETLTIYGQNVAANADEIEGFWNAHDIANATVKVHALKSTSRAIGAESLGSLAEKLELAGKAGDEKTLEAELPDLLARCRALGKALAPLYASAAAVDDEELPLISDDELREAYDSIREFAVNLDSDSARYVLEDYLDGFRIPEGERERVEAIRRAVRSFDWDKIGEILP